jgi:hypothetical protein
MGIALPAASHDPRQNPFLPLSYDDSAHCDALLKPEQWYAHDGLSKCQRRCHADHDASANRYPPRPDEGHRQWNKLRRMQANEMSDP